MARIRALKRLKGGEVISGNPDLHLPLSIPGGITRSIMGSPDLHLLRTTKVMVGSPHIYLFMRNRVTAVSPTPMNIVWTTVFRRHDLAMLPGPETSLGPTMTTLVILKTQAPTPVRASPATSLLIVLHHRRSPTMARNPLLRSTQ